MRTYLQTVKSKLAFRLFIMYLLVITLPLFGYSLLSYKLSAANVENDYIKYKENLGAQITRNIDENVLSLQKQSSALFLISDDINYLLTAPPLEFSDKYFEVKERMDKYFLSILQMNDKLNGITLIDRSGEVRYTINIQERDSLKNSVKDEPWFQDTLTLNGAPHFMDPHENDFVFTPISEVKTSVISVSQAIFDYSVSAEPVGVLLVDQNVDQFFNDVAKINLQAGEQIAVVSHTGNLIFTNIRLHDKTKQAILQKYQDKTGIRTTLMLDGQRMLMLASPPSQYGFQVVSLVPVSELQKQSLFLRDTSALMLIIVTAFVLMISIVVSFLIVKPLKKLMSSFLKLERGDFLVKVPVKGTHELAQISVAFNKMVQNIHKLINENYTADLLRKQAEFNALQSQINPHFLYNTLYTTRSVIEQQDYMMASEMVQNLAEMFRYSLNQTNSIVTLRDEIQHVHKYVFLLEARFKGKYAISYDIEESLWNREILRFTLQPLIENAFQHGLEGKDSGGEIHISAKTNGTNFIVYIYDNGKGIKEERLKELQTMLNHENDSEPASFRSIGIMNVHSRLQIHFGWEYGLRIASKSDRYTTVKIILPLAVGEKGGR